MMIKTIFAVNFEYSVNNNLLKQFAFVAFSMQNDSTILFAIVWYSFELFFMKNIDLELSVGNDTTTEKHIYWFDT